MPTCGVRNCKSRQHGTYKTNDVILHQVPKDPEVRCKWLMACGRDENCSVQVAVCSLHFAPECYEKRRAKRRKKGAEPHEFIILKKGSVPTLLLNMEKGKKRCSQKTTSTATDEFHKPAKLPRCPGIPSYAELIQCTQNKNGAFQRSAELQLSSTVRSLLENVDRKQGSPDICIDDASCSIDTASSRNIVDGAVRANVTRNNDCTPVTLENDLSNLRRKLLERDEELVQCKNKIAELQEIISTYNRTKTR